jgi:UDP-glucose 4-epimerase
MKVLVTGSAGHLGEGLAVTLKSLGYQVIGVDIVASEHTTIVGSITAPEVVESCFHTGDGAVTSDGVKWIFHAATLHRPHIESHTRQQFIDVNITGTLNLLEASVKFGVESFVFTSSTSVFGQALKPKDHTDPAVWIDETVVDVPKNIYGVTKKAAEDLCFLFHKLHGLPCIVLRTSRFFMEDDFDEEFPSLSSDNIKVNEFLHRRAEITDIVKVHIIAAQKAPALGVRRYVISATTPFDRSDAAPLRTDAVIVLRKYFPDFEEVYRRVDWRLCPSIERIYDSSLARKELGWEPIYDFPYILSMIASSQNNDPLKTVNLSSLSAVVGLKGYHKN